MKSIFYLY